MVNAGPDQTITLPAVATLDGTVTDDGLPNPPATVTTLWLMVSGPGTVTFGNAAAVDTTASFSVAGTYVLRLTASDSAMSRADEITITVNVANQAPSVNAGPDQATTLPAGALLDGTVTDDGLPNPPATVTTTWTQVGGAGHRDVRKCRRRRYHRDLLHLGHVRAAVDGKRWRTQRVR